MSPDDNLTITEVLEQIKRAFRSFPDDELVKWRNETNFQTLKTTIDVELQKRYWNDKSEIVPHAFK